MRLKKLFGMFAAVAVAATAFLAAPAEAGFLHDRAPQGWGREQTVKHWVYYPRYHHRYYVAASTDPYSYKSSPRGYYPYYNSRYWRPAKDVRKERYNYDKPDYWPSWGYPWSSWHHRQWHAKTHGYHHRWHW